MILMLPLAAETSTFMMFVNKIRDAGWPMYPLGLCSLFALAVILERLVNLKARHVAPAGLIERVKGLVRKGHLDEARQAGNDSGVLLGRIFDRGIAEYQLEEDDFEQALLDTGSREMPVLERFLIILTIVGTIAPLLGLFGTVYGMILSFETIASASVNKEEMARGISIALITTASGLVIAIPAIVMNYFFRARVNRLFSLCENALLDVSRAWKLHRRDLAENGEDA